MILEGASAEPEGEPASATFRDRRGETLFIDARKLGTIVDRVHRELTDEGSAKIASTYYAWRSDLTPSPLGGCMDRVQATPSRPLLGWR